MLKIQNINELPDIGSRAVWQKLLGVSRQSLINAEHRGDLVGHKHDRRNVWYSKQNVLTFLGVTADMSTLYVEDDGRAYGGKLIRTTALEEAR